MINMEECFSCCVHRLCKSLVTCAIFVLKQPNMIKDSMDF